MKKTISLFLAIILIYSSVNFMSFSAYAKNLYISQNLDEDYFEESYLQYLNLNNYNNKLSDKEIDVDLSKYSAKDNMIASIDEEGINTSENGRITFDFECEEDGFYNLSMSYLPILATNSSIERKLFIDDKILYKGLEQLILYRLWDNNNGEQMAIKNGNEIRQLATQNFQVVDTFISDSQKRSINPYIIYLIKGDHTLTFESVKEPIKIIDLTFKAQKEINNYEEVKAQYSSNLYDGENIIYEAERINENTLKIIKSSQGISNSVDYSNLNTSPYHPYKIRLNTIGAKTWKTPGEFIEWEINVPEDGLYSLSFRARQNINRGVSSFRKLFINGEVPFAEANKVGFQYSTDFTNFVMGYDDQKYLFELKKGINKIKLENNLGDFSVPLSKVEKSLIGLNTIYRKTTQLIGLVPDKYIDYEIEKKLPEFKSELKKLSDDLFAVVEELVAITGEKGEKTILIEKMAVQALRFSNDPEKVITEIGSFKNNISSVGDWIVSISEMPLEIDCFTLYNEESSLPTAKVGFFDSVGNGLVRFFATFLVDNNKLSESTVAKEALKVWVPTGRDQAQIINNMIDDSFNSDTDIPINLQLIPKEVILTATLSGVGPDIVVDLGQEDIMNFAQRNALVDYSKLEGYDKVREKFYDSAIQSVTYNGGVFGLPEKQWFYMMYVREDIFAELGLTIPKTWDEFEKTIAVLNINNYDAYLPNVPLYSTLVFQNGGNMYNGVGKDYGISSGLDSKESMQAFKMLTEFFTSFKIPVTVDFTNRFRTGEMPIGLEDYTFFNKLELFAPEIRGLWSFNPIPGVEDENGNINNVCVTNTNQCIILKNTRNVDDSWTFVKWWLEDETQLTFAQNLESILGTSGRYATANKNVLKQLPWSKHSSEQLLGQLENTVGVPAVPGSYMSTRMIDYAFKKVVVAADAMSPREALYLNVKVINKELTKKRTEFGLDEIK